MYFVYILFSSSLKKYYAGSAMDVQKRLEQHNAGKGNFTSKGIPWTLITCLQCPTRAEAVKLERKIKKRGIKRYLKDHNLA